MLSQEERTAFLDARLARPGGESTAALIWRFVGHALAVGTSVRSWNSMRSWRGARWGRRVGTSRTLRHVFGRLRTWRIGSWWRGDARIWRANFGGECLPILGCWECGVGRRCVNEWRGRAGLAADLWTQKPDGGGRRASGARGDGDAGIPARWRCGADELARRLPGARGKRFGCGWGMRSRSQGAYRYAALAFQRAWEQDLGNAGLLRKVVDSARQAGDAVMSEAIRKRVLEEKMNPGMTPRRGNLRWNWRICWNSGER
jgi:hypothetical protein